MCQTFDFWEQLFVCQDSEMNKLLEFSSRSKQNVTRNIQLQHSRATSHCEKCVHKCASLRNTSYFTKQIALNHGNIIKQPFTTIPRIVWSNKWKKSLFFR